MARFFPRLRGRPQGGLAAFLALSWGLMACDGPAYPPPAACAGCAASAQVRAEMQRGGGWSRDAEEPRTQRALTRSQVASRSVRMPLLPRLDPGARSTSPAQGPRNERAAAPAAGGIGPPASLVYRPGAEGLTIDMKNRLRGLALVLRRDDDLRIELRSYAGPPGAVAMDARQLALRRAMAVRAYLIEQDVGLDQIDVRAFGVQAGRTAPDRLDIVTTGIRS